MRFSKLLAIIHPHLSITLKILATRLFIVGVFLFLIASSPHLVLSQQGDAVEIQTNRTQAQFPDEMTFKLNVNTSSPIDSIELELSLIHI